MNTTDKKIAETLAKFGEPMAGNIWRVQGNAVIYHKALERIAQQAKIQFDAPTLVRAERDECVILVTGRLGDRAEWSLGEALLGTNYRVSGKQAAYVYAMAEKRAKDRVILKLIELHGLVYSEEESDDFKHSQNRPDLVDEREEGRERVQSGGGKGAREYLDEDRADDRQAQRIAEGTKQVAKNVEDEVRDKIRKAKSINAVTDYMLHADTQKLLNELPEGIRDEIRDCAKARLVELGWPTKAAAKSVQKDDKVSGAAEDLLPDLQSKEASVVMLKDLGKINDVVKKEKLKAEQVLKAKEDLVAWAKANSHKKARLQPADKTSVQESFDAVQERLSLHIHKLREND